MDLRDVSLAETRAPDVITILTYNKALFNSISGMQKAKGAHSLVPARCYDIQILSPDSAFQMCRSLKH